MQHFANPGPVPQPRQCVAALGLGGDGASLFAVGLYLSARSVARRLPAGRNGAHHVRACAGRLDGALGLYGHGAGERHRHHLPPSARRHRGQDGGTDRRRVSAFLALVTGSLWGKPMWGTWWVWDARLTSMFVLFLLYLGYIAVWQAIEDPHRAAPIARIVAIVGFVNVPIVKFSVDWWNSLHQPASVFRMDGPTIDASLLWPLLVMALAYLALFVALHLVAMRSGDPGAAHRARCSSPRRSRLRPLDGSRAPPMSALSSPPMRCQPPSSLLAAWIILSLRRPQLELKSPSEQRTPRRRRAAMTATSPRPEPARCVSPSCRLLVFAAPGGAVPDRALWSPRSVRRFPRC